MAKFQLRGVGVRREPASRERRDRRERDWCERGCEQDRRGEGRETGAGPTIRMGGEGGMPDSRGGQGALERDISDPEKKGLMFQFHQYEVIAPLNAA